MQNRMKRALALVACATLVTAPLHAQGLLDLFGDMPTGKDLERLIEAA
ncbi:MAG: hypothetical protein AAFY07_06855 [Pseudomonadota bacterium]